MQQDVITDCLHDEDLSIRLQALDLEASIVTSDTLQFVVNTLLDQLRYSPVVPEASANFEEMANIETHAHMGDGTFGETTELNGQVARNSDPLPNDYRVEVLHRILDICSRNNYSELPDFEWYIDVLVQLVVLLPKEQPPLSPMKAPEMADYLEEDIASRIGSEIRNIAVRVKSIRMETTRAAESLALTASNTKTFSNNTARVMGPVAWVIGEYAEFLAYPARTIRALTNMSNVYLHTKALSLYLQAIPKVFVYFANHSILRDPLKKGEILFLLEQVIEFFEALSAHPDLDIQERSIEFLEILRLAAEALRSENCQPGDMPLLLSTAIPGLFLGLELNPVAVRAQRKVPFPEKLILDSPLNNNLSELFNDIYCQPREPRIQKAFHDYYYSRQAPEVQVCGDSNTMQMDTSYHTHGGSTEEEAIAIARRRAERRERNKDDPFYIGAEESSSGNASSAPFFHEFNTSNDNELDVDSIPIVDLAISRGNNKETPLGGIGIGNGKKKPHLRPRDTEIAADETIGFAYPLETSMGSESHAQLSRARPPLLQVDSSNLEQISLEEENKSDSLAFQKPTNEASDEVAMARAMQEVEKARREMQRESERIRLEGTPAEGTLIKKKKKTTKRNGKKRPAANPKGSHGAL